MDNYDFGFLYGRQSFENGRLLALGGLRPLAALFARQAVKLQLAACNTLAPALCRPLFCSAAVHTKRIASVQRLHSTLRAGVEAVENAVTLQAAASDVPGTATSPGLAQHYD